MANDLANSDKIALVFLILTKNQIQSLNIHFLFLASGYWRFYSM
jgi:hypothetical protein